MVGLVPTPIDRPDYYPDPAGARTLQWSNTGGATGPQTVLALQDVADWPTLLLNNVGTGAPANASIWTVTWWADALGTLAAAVDFLIIPPAVPFDVVLPVKAPYVSISAASATGAGTHPIGGYIGVSAIAPAAHGDPPLELVRVSSVSVGAGVTTTFPASKLRPGRATLTMSCSAAVNWQLAVLIADSGGTYQWQYRWVFLASVGDLAVEILLPRSHAQIAVTNSDAAARLFTGSLVAGH